MSKSTLGRKRFTSAYIFRLHSITEGSQDRNLEEGTDAEAMKDHWLLACSSWLAQAAFLELGLPAQGGGTIHRELEGPHQSSVKKIPDPVGSPPQMTLVHAKFSRCMEYRKLLNKRW